MLHWIWTDFKIRPNTLKHLRVQDSAFLWDVPDVNQSFARAFYFLNRNRYKACHWPTSLFTWNPSSTSKTLSIQSVRLTGWQELCASLGDPLKSVTLEKVILQNVLNRDVFSAFTARSRHHLEHLSVLSISIGREPAPSNWLESINLDFPKLKTLCADSLSVKALSSILINCSNLEDVCFDPSLERLSQPTDKHLEALYRRLPLTLNCIDV